MPKRYAKSRKEYSEAAEFDESKILQAMKRAKGKRKPTSVALEQETIDELKRLGKKLGVPYQVLVRALILDGIEKLKNAA